MAARSIASLSLSFGLVSIPIKLYSATESSSAIHFKLMSSAGSRVRQQYVTDTPPMPDDPVVDAAPEEPEEAPTGRGAGPRVRDIAPLRRELPISATAHEPPTATPAVVERSEMAKGYEFEKGRYVLFTPDELKALQDRSRQTIDIVAFIPEHAVDPIYYQKAYFVAPDKRGAKAYNLLLRAMLETRRSALAKWAFRSKEYVVQIRPAEGGMVLQQLLYAEEVRSLADLHVELLDVSEAELKLAKQMIGQISVDSYDPSGFVDEEKQRILAAVEEKIAGKQIVAPEDVRTPAGAQVVDLMAALRASLRQEPPMPPTIEPKRPQGTAGERKPVKRAGTKAAGEAAPATGRARKR